jgi:hypothetical protein
MFFKLSDDDKLLIEEVAALSGIAKSSIREIWEYTMFHALERVMTADKAGKYAEVKIPFIGKIKVKFKEDYIGEKGLLETEVTSFAAIDPEFKKLIGDIHDDKPVLEDLIQKKIDHSIMSIVE